RRPKPDDRARRERHRRLLPEANRFFRQTQARPEPRRRAVIILDAPHHHVKIECGGVALELGEPAQIVDRRPVLAGHRMISPRCSVFSTISVNELSETYRAKKCSSTEPSRKTLVPSKAASSHVSVTSSPRPNVGGPSPGIRRTMGSALV